MKSVCSKSRRKDVSVAGLTKEDKVKARRQLRRKVAVQVRLRSQRREGRKMKKILMCITGLKTSSVIDLICLRL